MLYKIWLDDAREAPEGYLHIKTAEECIAFLEIQWYNIEILSLDHDLGENKQTGYDVVKYIEERVHIIGSYVTFQMLIHSDNPVGIKNMKAGIESIKKRDEINVKIAEEVYNHRDEDWNGDEELF